MLYTYAITDLRLGNALIKGIPIPSNELIYLVAGTTEVDWFLQSGRLAAQNISDITFSSFQVNPILGKLDFEDEKFDFIYALSVFTPLKEPQQFFWMNELLRVIKPGGYLFITVHGERFYLPRLLPED